MDTVVESGHAHVEHCMGTVFSIVVRDPGRWAAEVAEVVDWLHLVDALFSTYRPSSQVSRIRRGALTATEADPLVRQVLSLAEELTGTTDGYFTADLPGGLDPTGVVKGWAIEKASQLLRDRGSHNHAINGGGDMQLAGEPAPGRPWRVAVSDPLDRARILTVIEGRDLAVATSGTSERGEHIVDPFSGGPARAIASATVIGPSLTRADAFATAAFAMGPPAVPWIASQPSYELLLVGLGGESTASRGFPATGG